jgi:DNA-binding transcriptional MerR regulator
MSFRIQYSKEAVAQRLGITLEQLASLTRGFAKFLQATQSVEHGSWYTDKDIAVLTQVLGYLHKGRSYEQIKYLLATPRVQMSSGPADYQSAHTEVLNLEDLFDDDDPPADDDVPPDLPVEEPIDLDIDIEIDIEIDE